MYNFTMYLNKPDQKASFLNGKPFGGLFKYIGLKRSTFGRVLHF
jgi:hypothetical protein